MRKKPKVKHKLVDPGKMGRNLVRLCVERNVGIAKHTMKEVPTVYSIAQASGVAETTLREIFIGENYPGMETLKKLGDFLGIKIGELLVELTK